MMLSNLKKSEKNQIHKIKFTIKGPLSQLHISFHLLSFEGVVEMSYLSFSLSPFPLPTPLSPCYGFSFLYLFSKTEQ